jgi:hypothetical protein
VTVEERDHLRPALGEHREPSVIDDAKTTDRHAVDTTGVSGG